MTQFIARLRGLFFCFRSKFLRKRFSIGKGLRIYKRLRVEGDGEIHIGENCIIDGVMGDDSQYVCLDTHSREAIISIGNNARLFASRISAKYHIVIGDNFHIEESGITDTDFHSIDVERGMPRDESVEKCRIEIGDNVFVGARSFITKGTKVGDGAVIWPGSIVTASIQPGSTVCGNPARLMKL